jgi:ABC-type nitrate/sulfonate/bicarbonate transport system ATPase subunit
MEKYGHRESLPRERRGVAISRQDLVAIPVPAADLLWMNKRTRFGTRGTRGRHTLPFKIEITVEGINDDVEWSYSLEFDYANSEGIYCRPIAGEADKAPDAVRSLRVAYLPPMSGLAAVEDLLQPGSLNVRIGEGRTAEVLRNLCYQLVTESSDPMAWDAVCEDIRRLFGVTLNTPRFISERGALTMSYLDQREVELDLSSAGRGLQQVLLILAYMRLHEQSVLLLDEPDAHLEILRQRHIYNILADTARTSGSQIIIASHSEVVLREAAGKDVVVAFVGKPHRIDDRGKELLKALAEIDFDQYFQAEIRGWVLYLEGSTDLSILQSFAKVAWNRFDGHRVYAA